MSILKSLIPTSIKKQLRQVRKKFLYSYRRIAINIPVFGNKPMKVIVGAAETQQAGWYSTNQQWHDITSSNDWQKIFKGKKLISNLLAEHVFEHLTEEQSDQALSLIASHMLPGGRVRIAVPDGYNPNAEYIRHVQIRGIGADAADHKQLYNVDSLSALFERHGFKAEHKEGYNAAKTLTTLPVAPEHGAVLRSRQNPKEMSHFEGWNFVDSKSSLIIDGIKL